MKVKQFLFMFNKGSNAKVKVFNTDTDEEYSLFYNDMCIEVVKYIDGKKIDIGKMEVLSFTVINNTLTIYV